MKMKTRGVIQMIMMRMKITMKKKMSKRGKMEMVSLMKAMGKR